MLHSLPIKFKTFVGMLTSFLGFCVVWSIIVTRIPVPEIQGQVAIALALFIVWTWLNDIRIMVYFVRGEQQ